MGATSQLITQPSSVTTKTVPFLEMHPCRSQHLDCTFESLLHLQHSVKFVCFLSYFIQ
ncbi:hypothetical protein ACRRTK_003414 [Alexandromys fortis]